MLPWWVLLALLGFFFYCPFPALHMDAGVVLGTIKSQGWFWTEVSVSVIGWPAGIDGAWPMGLAS